MWLGGAFWKAGGSQLGLEVVDKYSCYHVLLLRKQFEKGADCRMSISDSLGISDQSQACKYMPHNLGPLIKMTLGLAAKDNIKRI